MALVYSATAKSYDEVSGGGKRVSVEVTYHDNEIQDDPEHTLKIFTYLYYDGQGESLADVKAKLIAATNAEIARQTNITAKKALIDAALVNFNSDLQG